MSTISLSAGEQTLELPPDLQWVDEFDWFCVEQSAERSLSGALIVDQGVRTKGRPITLQPSADDAAWMLRADLVQLMAWESDPQLTLRLNLRGRPFSVRFRRWDGAPFEARPTIFVADPLPGGMGD